jgi:uncharacterized protein
MAEADGFPPGVSRELKTYVYRLIDPEATRYAWKISPKKAMQADVILSTVQGLIKGAFVVDAWLEATPENFPGREAAPGRFGFVGREAPQKLWARYYDKRVPDKYRKPGAANPIKYTWP